MSKLTYTIDGKDFKEFGVHVADSDGLIDRPKIKKPLLMNWDNYHGVTVDLAKKYYDVREINLSCFITASGKLDFLDKVSRFQQVFDKPGTLRLAVFLEPVKPLVFEVYTEETIALKKKWDNGLMVGTFNLKLKEPEPVKRVLAFTRTNAVTTCEISCKSDKLLNVYWGDGTSDLDVFDNISLKHPFTKNGDYFIIVAGDIDEINAFTTNAKILWSKL